LKKPDPVIMPGPIILNDDHQDYLLSINPYQLLVIDNHLEVAHIGALQALLVPAMIVPIDIQIPAALRAAAGGIGLSH
jgi:hypothetical protein